MKAVAESAMREVIGRTEAIRAIVGGQDAVDRTDTQELLQRILDSYDGGIQITSINLRRIDLPSQDVIDAFRDVQTAKTERDSKRHHEARRLPQQHRAAGQWRRGAHRARRPKPIASRSSKAARAMPAASSRSINPTRRPRT